MYNKDRNLQRSNNKIMGKYNLKKQTGAISVFVMMAMLFFLLTILGIYLISTRRAQAQTEAFKMAQERYYSEDAVELYHKKIAGPNETIPIYTKEQLWSIGKDRQIEIEGKVYDFSGQDFSKYELKNDIIINISESLEIVDGDIKKNDYEIYYYYEENYYVPATGTTVDLTIGENRFVLKNNSSQTLGYVKDGLLLHYDGIKNTGTGHDSTATTWKDLSGNGNDGTLIGFNNTGASCWKENSLTFDGIDDYLSDIAISDSEELTFQVVMKSDTTSEYRNIYDKYTGKVPMLWLNPNSKFEFSINYTLKQDYSNQLISVTNAMSKTVSNMFVNNQKVMDDFNHNKELSGTYQLFNRVGKQTYKGEIYSVRIYRRRLTNEEIQQNYEIDKKRFNIQETNYVTDGLVLHYDGINNTGNGHASDVATWKDLSGNGNDGILNGATWEENSLNFDGINDFVNVNKSDTISPQNQTIEVVLKCNGPSKETSADKRQIFFVKWIGYTMELNTDNTISYGRSDKTTYLRSVNKLNHGTIANITATNGNNISTLYFNNIQENQTQTVPAMYSGMNNISIGNYSNGRHFNGNIYAIRMYNRVLTEAELAKNYEIDKKRFNIQETNYVTDGLVLHYDGINNTGNGHASGATTWKDLSGNGNDGILNGFNDDENNGWNANYLKFDGVNDSIVTSKEIDYKGSKAITVQFVDVNGIFDNLNLAMLFESSYNFNDVEGGYLIDTREHGEKGDLAFATSKKGYGYNAKNGKNILKSGNQMYTVICNNMNTHDNYISFFTNLDQANVEEIVPHNTNITNLSFANHKFYIGARNNAQYFAKMNLGSIRVYNKALSQEEIQKNYQIDKARFNIQ